MKDPKDKMLPEKIFSHLPTPELIEKERNANLNQIKIDIPNKTYQSVGIDIYQILIVLGVSFCVYKMREMEIEEKEQRMDERISRTLDIAETLHKSESARIKAEEVRKNKNNKLLLEALKPFIL